MKFTCVEVGNIGTYTLNYELRGKIVRQYSVLSSLFRYAHFEFCRIRHFSTMSFGHFYLNFIELTAI